MELPLVLVQRGFKWRRQYPVLHILWNFPSTYCRKTPFSRRLAGQSWDELSPTPGLCGRTSLHGLWTCEGSESSEARNDQYSVKIDVFRVSWLIVLRKGRDWVRYQVPLPGSDSGERWRPQVENPWFNLLEDNRTPLLAHQFWQWSCSVR